MTIKGQPTAQEINAVKLLQYVETLADKKAITGGLQIKNNAIDAMTRYGVAYPLKVVPIPGTETSKVTFVLYELYRYVNYLIALAGLDVSIDGRVRTRNGIEIQRDDS